MKKLFLIIIFVLFVFQVKSEEPALKINLNPPEEPSKDTIAAIKDIDKLENDLRVGSDDVIIILN
jgi:hypothetical protein